MILLTGFEPFGGQSTNPSWAAAESARDLLRGEGLDVEALELPCVFGAAANVLRSALEDLEPELVVCVGQAGGEGGCRWKGWPSTVMMPGSGQRREPARGRRWCRAGPPPISPRCRSRRPSCRGSGRLPAEVSQSAGTYVCNHIFYTLMHELAAAGRPGRFRPRPLRGHPASGREQHAVAAGAQMAAALAVVVRTALATTADLKLAAGATDSSPAVSRARRACGRRRRSDRSQDRTSVQQFPDDGNVAVTLDSPASTVSDSAATARCIFATGTGAWKPVCWVRERTLPRPAPERAA